MLVISRKQHQTIVIGEGPQAIKITVLKATPCRVKLGFQGPVDIRVARGEMFDNPQGQQQGQGVPT